MFLKTHADDFLNAFKILKESNEALIHSLSDGSGSAVTPRAFGTRPAMGVEIVCLAFSVELHIKDVHYAISGEPPRGHNILNLFKELPEWAQREIFHHPSIAQYRWGSTEFEEQLRRISDGFERWRYAYESASLRYESYFALVLIEATRSVTASTR